MLLVTVADGCVPSPIAVQDLSLSGDHSIGTVHLDCSCLPAQLHSLCLSHVGLQQVSNILRMLYLPVVYCFWLQSREMHGDMLRSLCLSHVGLQQASKVVSCLWRGACSCETIMCTVTGIAARAVSERCAPAAGKQRPYVPVLVRALGHTK